MTCGPNAPPLFERVDEGDLHQISAGGINVVFTAKHHSLDVFVGFDLVYSSVQRG